MGIVAIKQMTNNSWTFQLIAAVCKVNKLTKHEPLNFSELVLTWYVTSVNGYGSPGYGQDFHGIILSGG